MKKVKPLYVATESKKKFTIGNHEDSQKEDLKKYLKIFGIEGQFYSFNVKNVHFLGMGTEIPYKQGSEQYKFVVNDLIHASKDEAIDWTVVIIRYILTKNDNFLPFLFIV